MLRSRTEKVVGLIVAGVGALIMFVAGLFAYITVTTKPLHPDPLSVPSVKSPIAPERWAVASERARRLARAALLEQNLPGLSAAVGVDGAIAWAEGFGYADLENRSPVTPDTRFRVGVVSLPITAAAVGLLLEKNRLALDTDIQTYVPEFPEKQWPVTLRQLMGHLAGLRNDRGDEEDLSERCQRPADGVRRFARDALFFEPGTRFFPTSYGWILVSAAVETAAREPFHRFMHTQIFAPLGMADTIPDDWTEPIPRRATFYFPRFAANTRYGPEAAREGDYSCFAGAGAYLSTPSDLARFGMAVIRGTLVQPATLALLQAPQRLTTGETTGYGLGWKLDTITLDETPSKAAGHDTRSGFIGGAASIMTFPERGISVAVTSNESFANTASVALSLAQAFAAEPR